MRCWLAGLSLALACIPAAGAEVLLRDDFTTGALDASKWHQPEGCGTYFGRTQIRPPAHPLAAEDGALALLLETWNPSGLSFWGSELVSNAEFAPTAGGGLAIRARVRLAEPTVAGLDASLFLYAIRAPESACDAHPARDEIDFELLTSQIGTGQVLTNVYDAEPIGGAGAPAYPVVAGFDPRAWHELELRWSSDRIEWRVDGSLVRALLEDVPVGPMAVRLNFWATASDFPEAFASPPDPTASSAANQAWRYEVDWVEVATLPEPRGVVAVCAAAAALVALSGFRKRSRAALSGRAPAAARRGAGRCSRRSRSRTLRRGRPRDR